MDLFDLFAKISMDNSEYYSKLDEAGEKTSSFANKMKSGLTTAAKVGAAGLATAAAGVVAMSKQAVESYSEYEQLIGGVDTLFKRQSFDEFQEAHKDSGLSVKALREEFESMDQAADVVMKNAANAFKTAGLSANQYMETVTSFSASLLQSLDGDTAKAAGVADRTITDMSDNANKMGTDMQMIQNAYNGFAKQNFTMLDNLKLGYGGTKEEMQRLLEDAEKISGVKFDISSFADITEAIHVVQTEMGITGTTAKEASATISGSMASAKMAWQNLVTGIADGNADVDLLVSNFVESAGTAAGNLIPVVKTVLSNIGGLLEEKGPEMAVEGVKLLGNLAVGVVRGIPDFVSKVPEVIGAFVDEFKENGPEIKEIGMDIVRGIWDGITSLAGWLYEKVAGFFDGLFDGVKDHEEIHSPSKKWAFIGKYDALGIGSGWDEAFPDVKKRMLSGLDFSTAKVDFANSGFGVSSAGIINASAGNRSRGGSGSNVFELVLKSEEGQTFGRWMVPFIRSEDKSNPEVVSDAL